MATTSPEVVENGVLENINNCGGKYISNNKSFQGFKVGTDFQLPKTTGGQGKGSKTKKKANSLKLVTPDVDLHKQKLFDSGNETEKTKHKKKTIKWSDKPTYDHVGVLEMSV